VEPDLTVQQVADLFGKSPQTVRRWIKDRRLSAYTFSGREYRITRRALEEFQSRERNGRNGQAQFLLAEGQEAGYGT
jgi:excisionase family DNA binding protein